MKFYELFSKVTVHINNIDFTHVSTTCKWQLEEQFGVLICDYYAQLKDIGGCNKNVSIELIFEERMHLKIRQKKHPVHTQNKNRLREMKEPSDHNIFFLPRRNRC